MDLEASVADHFFEMKWIDFGFLFNRMFVQPNDCLTWTLDITFSLPSKHIWISIQKSKEVVLFSPKMKKYYMQTWKVIQSIFETWNENVNFGFEISHFKIELSISIFNNYDWLLVLKHLKHI